MGTEEPSSQLSELLLARPTWLAQLDHRPTSLSGSQHVLREARGQERVAALTLDVPLDPICGSRRFERAMRNPKPTRVRDGI
jgi:hypothetical protein